MKVGILGSGNVGRALAHAFTAEGHAVLLGTREPEKPELIKWQAAHPQVKIGSFADAAKHGVLLVLAVHYAGGASINCINLAGKKNFTGKVVIDTTNPLGSSDGGPTLITPAEGSAGAQHQAYLPQAKVVKAFNTIGNALMYQPKFPAVPDLFICGDDAAAKQTVSVIVKKFGLNPVNLGPITNAHLLECLAIIWITYGAMTNTWTHAFHLMRQSV